MAQEAHNVSDVEATIRLSVSAFIIGVSLMYLLVAQTALSAIVFAAAVFIALGLMKSSIQRYCPLKTRDRTSPPPRRPDDRHR